MISSYASLSLNSSHLVVCVCVSSYVPLIQERMHYQYSYVRICVDVVSISDGTASTSAAPPWMRWWCDAHRSEFLGIVSFVSSRRRFYLKAHERGTYQAWLGYFHTVFRERCLMSLWQEVGVFVVGLHAVLRHTSFVCF